MGVITLTGLTLVSGPWEAFAAEAPIGLGTAGAYSVLGGQTVTNAGPTRLNADLGVSPGSAITGFPPGLTTGATNAANAASLQAQSDLTIAYNDAAGRALTENVEGDLVGRTLQAGVYGSTGPLALSGTLTLDAAGDPDAVFIFQVPSTLITASASHVALIGGAQACNVYWQVGSSATLGTGSSFKGTILALASISVTTDAVVEGRALAREGAVTLDNNTFLTSDCAPTPEPSVTAPVPSGVPVPAPVPVPSVSAPVPSGVPVPAPVPVPSVSAPVPSGVPVPAPVPVPSVSAPVPSGVPVPVPTETSSAPLLGGNSDVGGTGAASDKQPGVPATNRGTNIQTAATTSREGQQVLPAVLFAGAAACLLLCAHAARAVPRSTRRH
ncbi:ice-binding family protein [Arthrobacter sp. L77]|uniref:ice-binding family protein n=1 Tax=Arthrobacter sp. L77 TaxID=1496689 RepID=UPI001E5B390F|nr:ice-binding family protein [Arthrobacter sp. L77]